MITIQDKLGQVWKELKYTCNRDTFVYFQWKIKVNRFFLFGSLVPVKYFLLPLRYIVSSFCVISSFLEYINTQYKLMMEVWYEVDW